MDNQHTPATTGRDNRLLSTCFEWVATMIGSLIAVVLVFAFVCRMVGVSGDSMLNTLQHNDRLLLITQFYTPQRGDVVVIARRGDDPLIKRVIATAGDTVDIDAVSGQVLLNGEKLNEPYVRGGFTPRFGFEGPYTVREGEVFAMGDNRGDSMDSRQLGAFSVDDLMGEAVFRLFPLSSMGEI